MKIEALRLERTARKAAFGKPKRADVRAAVRDLALTALRSRILTPTHLVHVAIAIENGVDPEFAQSSNRSSHSRALEGLQDAMLPAIQALDLAARGYAAMGGRVSRPEIDSWMEALAAMPPLPGDVLAEPLASLRKSLRAAQDGDSAQGSYSLGLIASGALLGLLGK